MQPAPVVSMGMGTGGGALAGCCSRCILHRAGWGGTWRGALGRGRPEGWTWGPAATALAVSFGKEPGLSPPPPRGLLGSSGAPRPCLEPHLADLAPAGLSSTSACPPEGAVFADVMEPASQGGAMPGAAEWCGGGAPPAKSPAPCVARSIHSSGRRPASCHSHGRPGTASPQRMQHAPCWASKGALRDRRPAAWVGWGLPASLAGALFALVSQSPPGLTRGTQARSHISPHLRATGTLTPGDPAAPSRPSPAATCV